MVRILESGFLSGCIEPHKALALTPSPASPDQNDIERKSLCASNTLSVLPMSAVVLVAACQDTGLGWQDQLHGTQMKDFPAPAHLNASSTYPCWGI